MEFLNTVIQLKLYLYLITQIPVTNFKNTVFSNNKFFNCQYQVAYFSRNKQALRYLDDYLTIVIITQITYLKVIRRRKYALKYIIPGLMRTTLSH